MTRASKLAFHLEMVIWASLPPGTRLNAQQFQPFFDAATPEQKKAAYERALKRNPLLLEDEQTGGYDPPGGAA